jgi:hypothetical protein
MSIFGDRSALSVNAHPKNLLAEQALEYDGDPGPIAKFALQGRH